METSPSLPVTSARSAPGNGQKKSLSQLIRLRDAKRETLSRLFEQKKKIMERMKTMNEELIDLDDEIEALEETRDQQREFRKISPQSEPQLLQVKSEPGASRVKSEPGASQATPNPNGSSPPRQNPPLTMNPDEILTEPTQTTPIRNPYDDEQLTDPLTWTQAETTTNGPLHSFKPASTLPQQQQQQPPSRSALNDENIGDYYYDSGDDHETGPPINNSSIIESKNNNYDRMQSTKLPPLQFESVHGSKPAASNRERPHESNQQYASTSTSAASSCPYSQHDIYQTLRQSFRLQTFRENQLEIIQSTLSGKDNFVLMKTGGGKSLLYQLPAVLESPKVTVVVSPLLSLIQDQEEQMNGFVRNSCVSFTSGMGASQHNENWNRVRDVGGGIMMILVTPERVFKSGKLKSELQSLDEQNRLGRFVIDECHCACQVRAEFCLLVID
jgi:hypothetical protein